MRTIYKLIAIVATAAGLPPLAAGEFLPLETGNRWVYRAASGADPFTISVGVPSLIGGNVYYSLNGYTEARLLVRHNEEGDLVWLDEEAGREAPLALFAHPETPYEIVGGGCRVRATVSERRVAYEGPAGKGAALEIRYEPVQCADAGFEQDLYLDNIGLVRRTVTTIAGPRAYDLVEARAGKWSFSAAPGGAARLSFDPAAVTRAAETDAVRFRATLRVSLFDSEAVRLRFPSSQDYDLVIRDQTGEAVYRWSAGKAFLAVIRDEEIAGERAWEIEADAPGDKLPDGVYQVEAWLHTIDNPRFAASGTIRVETSR